MEQILAFVLGVGTVLLVWGVVVAFRTASKVKNLEAALKDIIDLIDGNRRAMYEQTNGLDRRIDQEIDRVDQIYRECISHTDSRVDRLESKITTKELIKG
jgi:hypothetical protein